MLQSWYNEVKKLAVPVSALTPTGTSPKTAHWRCVSMDNPIVAQRKSTIMPESYHALAASKGMKWLGPFTGRTIDMTKWQCPRGHTFETTYALLSHTVYGCSECKRRTPEDYYSLAANHGYVWLGPEVETTMTPTHWMCQNGHEWETSFNGLGGCKVCSKRKQGDEKKYQASDYLALATARNLVWLGPEVQNVRTPTLWMCEHGHEFMARYNVVRRSKKCFRCFLEERSEAKRIKPEQYHAMAQSHGFEWLGPETKKTNEKTWWKCEHDHEWLTSYETIKAGASCPECIGLVNGRKASKIQKSLCDMLGGTLNHKIGRCTVDIALFVDDTKIAIEYDSYYWHAKTQSNDRRRAEYMIRRGWKALTIKSNCKLPSLTQLQDAICTLLSGQSYCEIVLDDWGGR